MLSKQKVTLISASTFVGTTIIMLVLCANAHIDFFPCKETVRDRSGVGAWSNEAPLVTREGTCSLMDHLRDDQFDPAEKSELTGAGWALLLGFCMAIAAADSALIYVLLSRKVTNRT